MQGQHGAPVFIDLTVPDDIDPSALAEHILVRLVEQTVSASSPGESVIPSVGKEPIVPPVPQQPVVARAPAEDVLPRTPTRRFMDTAMRHVRCRMLMLNRRVQKMPRKTRAIAVAPA